MYKFPIFFIWSDKSRFGNTPCFVFYVINFWVYNRLHILGCAIFRTKRQEIPSPSLKMALFVVWCITTWLLLLPAQWVTAQTGPNFCTYADGKYTCDYASMGTADRPIDYSGFSAEPQRLEITVNGFLPYISKS